VLYPLTAQTNSAKERFRFESKLAGCGVCRSHTPSPRTRLEAARGTRCRAGANASVVVGSIRLQLGRSSSSGGAGHGARGRRRRTASRAMDPEGTHWAVEGIVPHVWPTKADTAWSLDTGQEKPPSSALLFQDPPCSASPHGRAHLRPKPYLHRPRPSLGW
jgi:hypothetical protein